MSSETTRSSSVEVTNRLETTLVARCSNPDFFYEINDLRQLVDASSAPTKSTVEFEVVLRYADKPNEFLVFHARIEDFNSHSDVYYVNSNALDLVISNVFDEELKERMIEAFEVWSAFELKFSIE